MKNRILKRISLTALLLLSGLCLSSGLAQAQTTLRSMLRQLEEKHEISFVYESGLDLKSVYRGP